MHEHSTEQQLLLEIEKLQKQLQIANNRVKKAKYGLVWMDVPEAFEQHSENQIPFLEEVEDKAIVNKDGKPTHILIEGDNYHALTCLNYTHRGKVDLVYIDPPYNTGSDGFRYRDKRILETFPDGTEVPKDHPLRHSYWLSFMSKRLELAYQLLRDEAVMFISINEEEYAQLKLLCDSIFQESNYLTTFTVKVRHEDRILKGDKDYHETTEQLLLYRKSSKYKTIKRLQDNTSIDKYIYEIEELEQASETVTFGSKEVQVFKPGQYKIHKGTPGVNKFQLINIRGSIKEGNSSGRFHMSYLEERNNLLGYLYKVPNMGDDGFPYRYFLTRTKETLANGSYFQGVPSSKSDTKEVPYPNFLDFEEAFNNVGNEGGVVFRNGKKPVDFIKFILSIGCLKKDAVILDFFAGSGSTGHAVMEQNYIDGGNRQAILCTINENNIPTDVTYPRLKNVIGGYKQVKNQREVLFDLPLNPKSLIDNTAILQARDEHISEKNKERYTEIKEVVRKDRYTIIGETNKVSSVKGLGNSLKYYKTNFIGKNNILSASDEDKAALAHKAGYLLALAENTLYQLEATEYYQIFESGNKLMAVYFKEELDEMELFLEKVQKIKMPVSIYLFSWGNQSDYESLFDHMPNVTLKTIPQPILEIYKNIYNLVTI